MKAHEKQYILEHAQGESVQQIAKHLHMKERLVRRFLYRTRKDEEAVIAAAVGTRVPSWKYIFVPVVLILAGLLAFAPSFSGVFLLDDTYHIVDNLVIRKLWPLRDLVRMGRPLVYLSLAVNYALGGLNVWGYHALNLGIHILSALTLFGLARRTLLTAPWHKRYGHAATGLGLAIALLWLVHPLQTQSVTYMIQRSESMTGLFYLLTFYCVLRSTDSIHRRTWEFGAVISCIAGMATKEVMVTAPLAVLLYDRVFLVRSWKEVFHKRLGLYVSLAATWAVLAIAFLSSQMPAYIPMSAGFAMNGFTALDYALTQPGVILHYLRLAV